MTRTLSACLLLLAFSASAWSQATPKPAAPAATADTGFKERAPYRIGPGDVLTITVWNEPQISQQGITVLTDGKVNLPLVGEVEVAGTTLRETEERLKVLFKPFITDPDIVVGVKESNSQRVFVVGAVRKEGALKMMTQMTVLQAIAEAGGLTEFAKRGSIYVLRNQGGKQVRLPFDYNAVISGDKPEQNIVLQTGDTVVVRN